MEGFWTDLQFAIRSLKRRSFLTLVAGASLATGIGLNAGTYSVLRGVLLKPLPFGEPDRLMLISSASIDGQDRLGGVAAIAYRFLQQENTTLSHVAAAAPREFDLSGDGVPERVSGAQVTASFLGTLGLQPALGAGFEARGDVARGLSMALISNRLWGSRYASDPGVIGKPIRLDGSAYTIVGVMPPEARFPATADLWVPLDIDAMDEGAQRNGSLFVLGRASPNVTPVAATEEIVALGSRYKALNPEWLGAGLEVSDVREPQVRQVRPILLILMTAVGLLLGMTCLNVANLFLVQGQREFREISLRKALGGDGRRIVRQEFVRYALLSVVAGIVGTLLGIPLMRIVVPLAGIEVVGFEVGVDVSVLLLTGAVAIACSVLIGLLPTIAALKVAPSTALTGSRGSSSGRHAVRVYGALVCGQVAIGVLLLAAASSVILHLRQLENLDPGFNTDDVLTARVGLPAARYPTVAAREAFLSELETELEKLPGVASAASTSSLHFGDFQVFWSFSIEDQPPERMSDFDVALGRLVTPGYFETMGIQLLEGRVLERLDGDGSEPVVVVSKAFARTYWPTESAVGKRIKRRTYDSPFPWLRIVGVVEDVRDRDMGEPYQPTIYFPYGQMDTPAAQNMSLALASTGSPANLGNEVRSVVGRMDPDAAVFRVGTMRSRIDESLGKRALGAILLGAFGGLGLLLSLLGVYGVVSEVATRRQREMGIRMALGANRTGVFGRLVGFAAVLGLIGAVTGCIGTYFVVPRAASMLPGLEVPAWIVAMGAFALLMTTVLASIGPALVVSRGALTRTMVAE